METHPLIGDAHQTIVDFIDARRAFAVVTVLADAGSTPRKAGTKMLVDAEGLIWGTIGGGLLESRAREMAREAIRSKRPAVFDFKFTGTSAAEGFPVCGGSMRVLIDPNVDQRREAYALAVRARSHRQSGKLVTSVGEADVPRIDVTWYQSGESPVSQVDSLIESIIPGPILVIVGGGHVAQALAQQADLIGFELIVIEDREEFARKDLFPARADVRYGESLEIINTINMDGETYIALVSRGHLTDGKALAACIHKSAAYIGMMGSRRKIALMREEFMESGLATAEEFDRVHAPIGLDIGAQTVPEIAASIVAELIAVRRGHKA